MTDANGKPIDFANLPANSVVMGKTAADKLNAKPGDKLTVYIQNQPKQLTVAAISADSIMTGMTDVAGDGGFAMPLAEAQAITSHQGQISLIAVSNTGGVKDSIDYSDQAVQRGRHRTGWSAIPRDSGEEGRRQRRLRPPVTPSPASFWYWVSSRSQPACC